MNRVLHLGLLLIAILVYSFYKGLDAKSEAKSDTKTDDLDTKFDPNQLQMSQPLKSKLPVYFFSHGGPTFMYSDKGGGDVGAFNTLKKLGKHIKETIKPDFLIVVSAHWQADGPKSVNIDYPSGKDVTKFLLDKDENPLIYDFYNFPKHMYEEQFHSRGSHQVAQEIGQTLEKAGFTTKLVTRGIDHGVWVPFKVAFTDSKGLDTHKWDVDFPVIQVSLTGSYEHDVHHELGQLLAPFREKNGLIICSGMSVHNLRDFRVAAASNELSENGLPYVEPFNKILTNDILSLTGEKRLGQFNNLYINHLSLYKQAHPTNEHFLPVVVAAGAAEKEKGVELYNNANFSLGWGIYEFNG